MTEAEALTAIAESLRTIANKVSDIGFILTIINLCLWCILIFKDCHGGKG